MPLAPTNGSTVARPVPHRPLVPVALAALSGAALGPLLPAWLLVPAALAAPLGVVLARREARRRGRPRWRGPGGRGVVAATLVGVAGLLGLHARGEARARAALDPRRAPAVGVVQVEGTLAAPPSDPFPGVRSLLLDVVVGGEEVRLLVEGPAHGVHGRPLPGARLVVRGRFVTPSPEAAAGLRDRGLAFRLQAADVREVEPGRGVGAFLGALARAGGQAIDAAGLPPDQAAFLRAIVLGDRADLPRERSAALRATGTAHLLSISGLHVTLLAGVALALARAARLAGVARAAAVVLAVVLYVGVSGAAVPVLRAAAAGVVAFSLPWRGDGWNRLAVGLLAALAWDPLCPWSIGTILSFGTVGLLLLVEPWLRAVTGAAWPVDPLRDLGRGALGRLPRRRGLAAACAQLGVRSAAGAVAAFLASAPLIAWTLGDLPLVALVANPPAIALFGLALGLGAVGVAIGAAAPPLGAPLLRLAGAPVAATFAVVDAAAAVPGGRLSVPTAAPALAVLAAGLVALGAARRERRPGCRWARAAVALGAALGLGLCVPWPRSAPPILVLDPDRRRAVVAAGGGAVGLGPAPGARLRAALTRTAGVPGSTLARWGRAGSSGGLLAVPLVATREGDALVRLDLAGARLRVLVVVDPRPLLRGRGRERLAALAPDALSADALVVLGPPASAGDRDAPRRLELARELARRTGATTFVADVEGLDPAALATPDRDGRVPLGPHP